MSSAQRSWGPYPYGQFPFRVYRDRDKDCRYALSHPSRLLLPAFRQHQPPYPSASSAHFPSAHNRYSIHSTPIYLFLSYPASPYLNDQAGSRQNRQYSSSRVLAASMPPYILYRCCIPPPHG